MSDAPVSASADSHASRRRSQDAQRPPRHGSFRILDANGEGREKGNLHAALKWAANADRVCPLRELPHRVEQWNGSEWHLIDQGVTAAQVEAAARAVAEANGDDVFERLAALESSVDRRDGEADAVERSGDEEDAEFYRAQAIAALSVQRLVAHNAELSNAESTPASC